MDEQGELAKAVVEAAKDIDGKKKLACAQAFELARRLEVPLSQIGRICNDNNIKIGNCQLGCFK